VSRILIVEPTHDGGSLAEALRGEQLPIDRAADAPGAIAAIASGEHAAVIVDLATPQLTLAMVTETLGGMALRPMVLLVADDFPAARDAFQADLIHGLVRRDSAEGWLPEWLAECASAFGSQRLGTVAGRRAGDSARA